MTAPAANDDHGKKDDHGKAEEKKASIGAEIAKHPILLGGAILFIAFVIFLANMNHLSVAGSRQVGLTDPPASSEADRKIAELQQQIADLTKAAPRVKKTQVGLVDPDAADPTPEAAAPDDQMSQPKAPVQTCDAGFKWMGSKIGCVGETLTNREDVAAFDRPHTKCEPGTHVTVYKDGVMPNGRKVKWEIKQTCHG